MIKRTKEKNTSKNLKEERRDMIDVWFFFFKFIYPFIHGCVGSSFLCEGFL